jgi:glutamate synthase domain-containing protein 3
MDCLGQRYIGCGSSEGHIVLHGTPGNALGAYMDGARITLYGNAQDATGDTMNSGCIYIHGNTGDAAGYAMRGGEIYIKGDAGYRAGIHMKEYKEMIPVMVIGGKCGSFLGEYQAGGIIIVLGLGNAGSPPVGRFCGTGMHGGRIYIRSGTLPWDLPEQVAASAASPGDMEYISVYLKNYCEKFGEDYEAVSGGVFQVLKPNTKSPYKQLYVFY